MNVRWSIVCLLLVPGLAGKSSRAADIGTAFTYQGYLESPPGTPVGSPAPELCDFRFGLWDAAAGGNQQGTSPQTVSAVSVADGVFTVTLDFSADAIDGTARWLEIEVKCPPDVAFTLLAPRVELTPAPYALSMPGMRSDQTGGSPNVLGGIVENFAAPGIEGATISGGGAPFTSTDGRCAQDSATLCASNTECDGQQTGPCVTDASVGRCDDDNALCDETIPCATGTCIFPQAPNQALADFVTIGGGHGNVAGGDSPLNAVATGAKGYCSTISGGCDNRARGRYSAVGGGGRNRASGLHSTVGGGDTNTASLDRSTVGGGGANIASGGNSTVGGGVFNTASGSNSTVPGGANNTAGGDFSFAAGFRAKTNFPGTLVWADSDGGSTSGADFASTGIDQFLIRAAGGVGINTNDPDGSMLAVYSQSAGTAGDAVINLVADTDNNDENDTPYLMFGRDATTDAAFLGLAGDAGTAFNDQLITGSLANALVLYNRFNEPLQFGQNGTIAMTIDNGDVGIGTPSPTATLHVRNLDLSLAASVLENDDLIIESNDAVLGLYSKDDATWGSAIAFKDLELDGTLNDTWGIVRQSSGTGDSSLRFTYGTSDNYATNLAYLTINNAGFVGIFDTTPDAKLDVVANSVTVARLERIDDGIIVEIVESGVVEGTISVLGPTVSYNAFTGSHYAWTEESISRGMLVTLTGDNRRRTDDAGSEPTYGIAPSAKANDPRCLGAYLGLLEPSKAAATENPHQVMAVGNGDMWVVDTGRNIEPGQYLISSDIKGHAMLDDAERFAVGYVVARAAEPVDWSKVTDSIDGHRHKRISVFFESFERGNSAGMRELHKLVADQKNTIDVLQSRVVSLERASNGSIVRAGLPLAILGLAGLVALRRRSVNGGGQ